MSDPCKFFLGFLIGLALARGVVMIPDEISKPSCPTEQNIHCREVHMAILDAHFPCDQIDELKYNRDVFTARCTDDFEYRAMLVNGVYRVSEKRDQL